MNSTIDIPVVGILSHPGVSRHWTGEVAPSTAAGVLELSIDGTPDGPAPGQAESLRKTLGRWDAILAGAETGMRNLLRASGLPYDDPRAAFEVVGISVPSIDYDPSGAVHVHIDLVHAEYPDEFWPAIDVVDGEVRDVLSGT